MGIKEVETLLQAHGAAAPAAASSSYIQHSLIKKEEGDATLTVSKQPKKSHKRKSPTDFDRKTFPKPAEKTDQTVDVTAIPPASISSVC